MIVSVTFVRPGKGTAKFTEQLVIDRPDVKVLLLARHTAKPIYQNNRLILGRDAPIIWFVFPDRWHEIGRFHTTNGKFTGWYTNICTPFEIHDALWSTTDLFLDFWQPADGGGVWLDEEELRDAVANGELDEAARQRVQQEKDAISQAFADSEWPPPITRAFDLEAIHAVLRT